jgi:esterase/lipase superfamily enzyme
MVQNLRSHSALLSAVVMTFTVLGCTVDEQRKNIGKSPGPTPEMSAKAGANEEFVKGRGMALEEVREKAIIAGTTMVANHFRARYDMKAYTKAYVEEMIAAAQEKIKGEPVQVFYGTNRTSQVTKDGKVEYGIEPSQTNVGMALVTIPPYPRHIKGRVERPKWWQLDFKEDPEKHVVVADVAELSPKAFAERLRDSVNAPAGSKELFIFVHGYQVTFEEALRRTAQLHYDLEFAGTPVLFSWPSQGSLLGYWADEDNVDVSVWPLKDFIKTVARDSGASSVHLVGHSMGSRLITKALVDLALERDLRLPAIDQLVFAAPDVYTKYFHDSLASLKSVARHVTLYASSNDRALYWSKWFHWHARAGESGRNIFYDARIDTIDVSDLDTSFIGHSYYGDNRSVISDLYNLIRYKHSPPRFGLKLVTPDNPRYWLFQSAN